METDISTWFFYGDIFYIIYFVFLSGMKEQIKPKMPTNINILNMNGLVFTLVILRRITAPINIPKIEIP